MSLTEAAETDAKEENDVSVGPQDRILFYGNLCVDQVMDVAAYPQEDTGTRALDARKTLGGNGANSTRVLRQLRGDATTVSWIGPVAQRSDVDTRFALGVLSKSGVDFSLLEEVGGEGLPMSMILSSRASGSRTIVSTRNGVRELSSEHLARSIERMFKEEQLLGRPCWCHLECRQPPDVTAEMARAWRASGGGTLPLSVEIEKPGMEPKAVAELLRQSDYAFFSSEWVDARHDELVAVAPVPEPAEKKPRREDEAQVDHRALRCLRALRAVAEGATGVWICGWGELGAFALDAKSGSSYFEPAVKQARVVDSVGAGDTFVAAAIHALVSGASPQGALRCGCAVAGLKVSQVGFGSLREAVPADLS
jgi:ketohexokinase